VVVIATDPASLPLRGLPSTATSRRLRPLLGRQASATPVGQAGQLAEQFGGELTVATGGAAPASRLRNLPVEPGVRTGETRSSAGRFFLRRCCHD
jgi:hypothetical protein